VRLPAPRFCGGSSGESAPRVPSVLGILLVMVQVRINGKERELPESTTLLHLLQERGIDPRVVVVEYNYEIVPRDRYSEITLRDGDNPRNRADDRRRLTMRVLVVGAGVIGAAVARELLQRGAEVVLLDGAAEGGHTSAASAGMVNPFSLTPDDTPALPLYWQSLQMYPEWTRTLHERTGIDPEWRERGLPACCAHPCGRRASGGEFGVDSSLRRPRRANRYVYTAHQMEPALNPEVACCTLHSQRRLGAYRAAHARTASRCAT
jgi:sulfur carrier protein